MPYLIYASGPSALLFSLFSLLIITLQKNLNSIQVKELMIQSFLYYMKGNQSSVSIYFILFLINQIHCFKLFVSLKSAEMYAMNASFLSIYKF